MRIIFEEIKAIIKKMKIIFKDVGVDLEEVKEKSY